MYDLIQILQDKSILYIEDDYIILSNISEIFDSWFKNTYTSENGLDGYKNFINNKIDLIITDIDLPLLNGIDMIKRIREIDREIPIIIASSYSPSDFANDIDNLNILSYIEKPFTFNDIRQAIIQFVNINNINL